MIRGERGQFQDPGFQALLKAERPVIFLERLPRRQTRSLVGKDRISGDGFGGRFDSRVSIEISMPQTVRVNT